MLFAVARDVARGAPIEDLKAWRCHALSTTTQFVYHATHDDMYFAACQLRENMGQYHMSMSRTALQRVYEIARFRDTQIRMHGPAAGSAQAVFHSYERVKTAGKKKNNRTTCKPSIAHSLSWHACFPSHRCKVDCLTRTPGLT